MQGFVGTSDQRDVYRFELARDGELALQLNREFAYRYDRKKDHASISVIKQIESHSFENLGLTEFAQAMPDCYKVKNNTVRAYRSYYRGEKARFARWKKRKIPYWMNK